eukprot:2851964-Rhodomonas_salina.2
MEAQKTMAALQKWRRTLCLWKGCRGIACASTGCCCEIKDRQPHGPYNRTRKLYIAVDFAVAVSLRGIGGGSTGLSVGYRWGRMLPEVSALALDWVRVLHVRRKHVGSKRLGAPYASSVPRKG